MNEQDRQRLMICGCRVDGPTGLLTHQSRLHHPGRVYRTETAIAQDEALIAQGENDQEEGRR